MEDKMIEIFKELDHRRDVLYRIVEALPEEKHSQRPSEGGWSLLQVLGHLVKVEAGTLQYVKKKLQGPPPTKKPGIVTNIKMALNTWGQGVPIKIKAIPSIVDEDSTHLNDVKENWIAVRKEMKELYKGLSPEMFHVALVKNPFIGRVSIYQQMRFIGAHMYRHKKQMLRIIREIDKA